jgi:hypothetical protein
MEKRKGRGPQKKEKFVHINIRIDRECYEYLLKTGNVSKKIREILEEHLYGIDAREEG